jgi:ribosomal protein L40E
MKFKFSFQKKEPIYKFCPIATVDPKTKKPLEITMSRNIKTGEYEVPVKELNPTLILRNTKTGELEDIKWNELKKRLSKEQKIRIDERLKIMFELESKNKIPFVKFKDWNDVKELFDEESQEAIEKFINILGKMNDKKQTTLSSKKETEKINVIICPKCKTENDADSDFCKKCGKKLK